MAGTIEWSPPPAVAWLALALQLRVTVNTMTGGGASLAQALWRYLGGFDGWHPYFFVDVGALGYARALASAAMLAAAMLLAGYVLVTAVKTLRRN